MLGLLEQLGVSEEPFCEPAETIEEIFWISTFRAMNEKWMTSS